MVNSTLESYVEDIEVIKPNIPGNLISALAPNILLLIKDRLIRRKIFKMNLSMALQKKPDLFSFMPFSPIYIEIDNKSTELFQHMLQHLQESLLVTFCSAYQAFPSQQRRYPAGQIKPLAVLAGCSDFEPLTFLSPASSQTGMQAKAGLILKNDGFIFLEVVQFFLTPGENGEHLLSEPEDKYSRLFSGYIPGNAASIVPVALSTLSQTVVLSEPPEWDHPNQLLLDQILKAAFPNGALIVWSRMVSVESAVLVGVEVSEKWFPSDSPHESSLPESCDLDRTKRLSIPDADPPKPAIKRQFLAQSMPPELALLRLIAFLWLLQIALYAKLSWLKYNPYFVNVQIFSAFVLVNRLSMYQPDDWLKAEMPALHGPFASRPWVKVIRALSEVPVL